MKKLLFVLALMLIFSLSCRDKSEADATVVSEMTVTAPTVVSSLAPLEETLVKLNEVTATPSITTPPVNPYSGKIWNQYCNQIKKDGMIVEINCDEEWALEPLPGGCNSSSLNYKGYSGCTATSLSYVINKLLSAEEINKVLGGEFYGVTPSYLIDYVYLNMDRRVKLSCDGTSVETLRLVLSYFGLQVRTEFINKNSIVDKVLPGEIVLVGISGKFEGLKMEHWTVLSGEREDGLEFADSLIGKGSLVVFDTVDELRDWEIISALFVSRTSP